MLPVVGTTHTAAGAEAFAKFFVQTLDWGFATVSSAYVRHYFDESCIACTSYSRTFDKTRAAGYRYIGGRLSILRTAVSMSAANGNLASVAVTFDATAAEAVDRKGKFVNAEPGHRGEIFTVHVAWNAGSWHVVELGLTTT